MRDHRRALPFVAAFASAAVFQATAAPAAPLDGAVAHHVPAGNSPGEARFRLPSRPQLAWQVRLQGAIHHQPAVAARGALVVASSGRLSQLEIDGKVSWTHRVRGASPAAPPVVTPSEHRVLVTSQSQLLVLNADGKLVTSATLPLPTGSQLVGPVATQEGTLVLAHGRSLIICDLFGQVIAETASSGVVAKLAVEQGRVWIATREGRLERWVPGVDLRQIADFGAPPSAVELLPPARGLAIVDGHHLVEVDLTRGKRRVLASDDTVTFAGDALVEHSSGTVHLVTEDGLLLSYNPSGSEARRVLLPPSVSSRIAVSGVPRLLLGSTGRIGFVLPSGDLGVVRADGGTTRAAAASCRDPVAIVSSGRDRLTVACNSGLIVGFLSGSE